MKRHISTLITAAAMVFAIQAFSTSTFAQGRSCDRNSGRVSERRYEQSYYGNSGYNTGAYSDPYYTSGNTASYDPYYSRGSGTYDRHRKAVNITAGTAVGAVVGALVGGRRGALIGAAAGAAGGAIVTAKQRPRNYSRYY